MMKQTLLLIFALSISLSASAQEMKKEHSIQVVGTAEMEIVPDEIFMSVTLKEYIKDKKKYNIEELEKNLVNFLEKTTQTDKKDVKMDNMSAHMIYMKRKKNKDEQITKSYDVKFLNSKQVYLLYSVMDSLGISGAYVSRYSHSKMDEYKKQIKINAIKAAKEKASYLLEAIGEKAGKAISISESSGLVSVNDGTLNRYAGNSYSNISQSYSSGGFEDKEEESIGGKTIKLRYDINAEFAIQ
ncbi:MAG: SIMPL domain-containing protein [Bacteroidota bacterium]|nr:SIMPL domain-containing protein [Bacteroidota bacterium]